jgi:N-acetylglucosaminyl-diphospho-decaprenol L-rhamnosyltransferase
MNRSDEIDVAIVIVTYNSAPVITDLLDSLPGALGSIRAQVVVVDNGSADETTEIVAARSDCVLVRSTNLGYSAGINNGVRAAAHTDTILILNPDVVMGPDSVAPLMAALADPTVGISTPQMRDPDGSLQHSLRREPTILRTLGLSRLGSARFSENIDDDAAYSRPQRVDWAAGAVLMFTRRCYDAVGGWDESYFLYSEETDFCLTARDHGLATAYVPDAWAVHIGAQSSQRSDKTHAMQVINRVRCYRRRHTAASSAIFMALTTTREALWGLRASNRGSRGAVRALLQPSRRPAEIKASDHLLPR